jgi:hypothetical protein
MRWNGKAALAVSRVAVPMRIGAARQEADGPHVSRRRVERELARTQVHKDEAGSGFRILFRLLNSDF